LRDESIDNSYHFTVTYDIKLIYYFSLFYNHFSWEKKLLMDSGCLRNHGMNKSHFH